MADYFSDDKHRKHACNALKVSSDINCQTAKTGQASQKLN